MKEKKEEVFDYFSKVLNREQDLSPYLLSFFKRIGFETSFIQEMRLVTLRL